MADQPQSNTPSPEELAKAFAEIAEHSQKIVNDFLERQRDGKGAAASDDLGLANAFMDLGASLMSNPWKLAEAQMQMWQDYMRLWQGTMPGFAGRAVGGGGRAREIGQPLQERTVAEQLPVRLHQAVVPDRARTTSRSWSPTCKGSIRRPRAR